MASIFTYDPNPPLVSSPWAVSDGVNQFISNNNSTTLAVEYQPGLLSEYGLTKLQAEPQEGPIEYKLHLLLRPRRKFTYMSTNVEVCHLGQSYEAQAVTVTTPTLTASGQSRQQRLQSLTTQLLWRLQQSSPYHASSSKESSMALLPDENVNRESFVRLSTLVPGLEESRGALYEIGVSDDGCLVGLTKDEIDESVNTLRIMAASLGCYVDVVRKVFVGDCEWIECAELVDQATTIPTYLSRRGKLWVAEAFVSPNIGLRDDNYIKPGSEGVARAACPNNVSETASTSSLTPQLRVTLTGPTTSGKSSLLGTLITGALDNGRGKSRLSLLRHRHEMTSGVTSSIAQELIGYKDNIIMNSLRGNIGSWVDIHDCSENGRLVFVSDSGGHPRYRRTVLRGLMNWAPHWSILCIAADDVPVSPGDYTEKPSAHAGRWGIDPGVDLVNAHLTLSLKLNVPIVIVITKLDLASKVNLQRILVKVLAVIKDAGRIPKILQPDQTQHIELGQIPGQDSIKVQAFVDNITSSHALTSYVPIVLTSALKGIGIGLVHALLQGLPLPPSPTAHDFLGLSLSPKQPKCVFHVEDTFDLPSAYNSMSTCAKSCSRPGIVVSGHARFGCFSVGDKIVVGPFPLDNNGSHKSSQANQPLSHGDCHLPISQPSSLDLSHITLKTAVDALPVAIEWHTGHIVSIRNLRLPVRTLEGGQAGSIGVIFHTDGKNSGTCFEFPRIRRGMIIAIPTKHMMQNDLSLQAVSSFTATFNDIAVQYLAIGSFVNVFVASVRATARVLRVYQQLQCCRNNSTTNHDGGRFEVHERKTASRENDYTAIGNGTNVSLKLLHNKEWIELGSKVFIMEGGKSGLGGFVGKITEISD